MKVFISSVITGFEEFRDAAREAIEALDHSVIRAEDFTATPTSAQVACLGGVRQADLVIVVLGARYGQKQSSGLSATHEEFREAKRDKDVFVFVQSELSPDENQRNFIEEAQDWARGVHTTRFSDANSLRAAITKSLVRWERSNVGQADPSALLSKASAALPDDDRTYRSRSSATLAVAIAVGPEQAVLRPSELEDQQFGESLQQMCLFGPARIFDPKSGTEITVDHHALLLRQDDRSFSISEDGTISVSLPLQPDDHFHIALAEEDVLEALSRALKFCSAVLDAVDGTERISTIVVAARVLGAEHASWTTRARLKRERSMSITMSNEGNASVSLSPPQRTRSAFRQQVEQLAQDLMVLIRRQFSRG